MNYLNIKVPEGTKITVVGDIHEHDKQFHELVKQAEPSEKNWLVSVGDIYDKGFGEDAANSIIQTIKELSENKIGFIIKGNHELKRIKKAIKEENASKEMIWLNNQPLSLSFRFKNGSRLTVVHAGVKPSHTWDDLAENTDVVYIRTLDEDGEYIPLDWVEVNGVKELRARKEGTNWHEQYDGRFGYIASGHNAQKDGIVKFYKYSCNLDTACYHTGILTAQIFSSRGKEDLIQVKGEIS